MKALLPLLLLSLLLSACVSFELVTPPLTASGPVGCVPQSCEALAVACGRAPDGCEGTQLCGVCTAPTACSAGVCTVNGKQLTTPTLVVAAMTAAAQSIISGTAPPRVTVRIFANTACEGEPVASTTADANGAYVAVLTLADQAHMLYADAQDLELGNASACSAGVSHVRTALQVSAASAALGNVLIGQTSAASSFTLTNGGARTTSVLSTVVSGDSADFAVVNDCSAALVAGASCQIGVSAAPQSSGPKSVTFTVSGQPGGSVTFTATANGRARLTVTVHELGAANGRVHANDASLDCNSGVCVAEYSGGTVTLSVTTQSGVFSGWLGACAGGGSTCPVVMTANRSAHAYFAMANIAFQSSRSYTLPLAASAAAAQNKADAECTEMARGANLPGTFVAWLSTSEMSAVSKLGSASGWVSVTGKTIAQSRADLLAARLRYSLVFDEHGVFGDNYLLTGSHADGTLSGGNCADFTSTSGSDATIGQATSGAAWSEAATGVSCDPASFLWASGSMRLACFQVDSLAGAPAAADVGRRSFVTSAVFTPNHASANAALVDADAKCQTASAALPGGAGGATFKALLATSAAPAASRFSASTVPWVRPDGVLLSPTPNGFLQRSQLWSAPSLQASGTYADGLVFTGTTAGDVAVTTAETCLDWTSTSNANTGQAWNISLNDGRQTDDVFCDQTLPLLCLED